MTERFGQYEIYEELGSGGLAMVHLARTRAVKSGDVALKRMYPHVANVRELVGSFIDEARLARYLKHPGIARVYEFGRLRGIYFIAFEFVPGPTLLQLYEHCNTYVGRIPAGIVLEIAYQLCDALDYAHNQRNELGLPLGIVHRDVSPSNVIVSNAGQVKLIDFGLAKTKQQSVQSQVGMIKGKLSYVAPEYLDGAIDPRVDLWALGVVMHELLTGRRLFDAPEQGAVLERVKSMPISPPSRWNPESTKGVDHVVMRALERSPEKRWRTAADMRDAIGACLPGRLPAQTLVAWVEWAFSQKQPLRREDSGVSALHDIMKSEPAFAPNLPAISEAMEARRRESIASIQPLGAELLRRAQRPRRWLAIALVVMMGIVVTLGVMILK